MNAARETKSERLENALLEYIEKNTKDTQPEIAATIPTACGTVENYLDSFLLNSDSLS